MRGIRHSCRACRHHLIVIDPETALHHPDVADRAIRDAILRHAKLCPSHQCPGCGKRIHERFDWCSRDCHQATIRDVKEAM